MSHGCGRCGIVFNSQNKYENHLKCSPRHQSQQVPAKAPQTRQPGKAIASSSGSSKRIDLQLPMAQDGKSNWSVIPVSDSQAVLDALAVHVHPEETLRESNFITRPFDPEDYVGRRKCVNCKRKEKDAVDGEGQVRECSFHPKRLARVNPKDPGATRLWLCCNSSGEGCQKEPEHKFQHGIQYTTHQDFLQTPPASSENRKFQAVTLDCEMAGIASGAGEAILLCATDYVSGAVIINKYVSPPEFITTMRSTVHGVSRKTLDTAVRNGEALDGWKGAREELWKYIDGDTILIGHALENDLNALRLIHPRIVDSGILAKKMVGIWWRSFGLRILCEELLEIEFRQNKGGIHNCLEDVRATREVVLFCTRKQEAFRDWAARKKIEETKKREEERKKNEEAREAKKKAEEERKVEEERKKQELLRKEALAVQTFMHRAELSGLTVST